MTADAFGQVFRYLCRVVGEPDTARDLTQEVYLRASRGTAPEVSDAVSPRDADDVRRAWLFRIARNLALNHLRDRRRRGTPVPLVELAQPATQELRLAIDRALASLAALDRDVFLLRESAGLSYADVAAACEITVEAVRARLHRARQQLRAELEPCLRDRQAARGIRLSCEGRDEHDD